MPNSECKLIFYSSVLIGLVNETQADNRDDLKKIVSNSFILSNSKIREASLTIFDQAEKYDIEILDRFADFFVHFISNFNFEWEWGAW